MGDEFTAGIGGQAHGHSHAAGQMRAAAVASLLAKLKHDRRFYLDHFMDGDGPYAMTVGLFSDEASGIRTSFEGLVEWSDESVEATWLFVRELMERDVIQVWNDAGGGTVYRLTPVFSLRFSSYLQDQFRHVRDACADVFGRDIPE
ncbi:hypothetical protein GGR88_002628 [Sphingomonas jejuensis]|uniref:Uncharacterized protein n=1 Tax=Sphingomonas jejuensis TaxID=904715 RepID=A0ABX0XP07_9SPHN|nr:hypothetical protein [Sphingomonas jejuensis]NJC35114.1 hypothetical protein [Sphingomonas jejuensis]